MEIVDFYSKLPSVMLSQYKRLAALGAANRVLK